MQARTAKKMSQKDVANKLNIQVSDFQKIENGTMKRNGELLNRLGKVLGVKLTGKGV
jgi:ribosome-binding protein aMBF1 (putative translation factor)